MLLAAMLIHAFHATLENREVAFDGAGRDDGFTIAARVLEFWMARRGLLIETAAAIRRPIAENHD